MSISVGKVLFVANDAEFFVSHRLPLALAAQASGYAVGVACPESDGAQLVRRLGIPVYPISMTRSGMRPLEELRSVVSLYRVYRSIGPDIIHHVASKPVIYGGLVARILGGRAVVNAITGLGHVFVGRGVLAFALRALVKQLYRVALNARNSRTIFQNPDDCAMFLRYKLVPEQRTAVIKGSGVDLIKFRVTDPPPGVPIVLLASRMLVPKGVEEFVAAARVLRAGKIKARFVLAGKSDPGNPAAISIARLKDWQHEGVIEWWGHRSDMPDVLSLASIVCLPSYYGEGVPKVLIEAAASGRAIVTTDTPGCREIVRNGENGLLVAVRDVSSLSEAIRKLLLDQRLRHQFGVRGRELAESEFSLEKVIRETLMVYRALSA